MTTKIHVIVDVAGKVLVFFVILAQRDDITGAELLLDEGDPETFIADKAYDADPFIKKLEDRRIAPVATSRKRRFLFLEKTQKYIVKSVQRFRLNLEVPIKWKYYL